MKRFDSYAFHQKKKKKTERTSFPTINRKLNRLNCELTGQQTQINNERILM